MNSRYLSSALLLTVMLFFSLSCSLKYDEELNMEDTTPELQFTNVDYKRYKKKKLDTRIQAEELERYRSDGSAYAKNTNFFAWNEKNEMIAEGNCALLGIDTNYDIYTMFNTVFIHNIEQNFRLRASNLRWNGKTEQLTSGENDTVYISRDDIEIEGSGFVASGVTRSFSFENYVEGAIYTGEDQKGNPENESTEETIENEE